MASLRLSEESEAWLCEEEGVGVEGVESAELSEGIGLSEVGVAAEDALLCCELGSGVFASEEGEDSAGPLQERSRKEEAISQKIFLIFIKTPVLSAAL